MPDIPFLVYAPLVLLGCTACFWLGMLYERHVK
jgi:hypothetical protein